jgi:hypothetical protein
MEKTMVLFVWNRGRRREGTVGVLDFLPIGTVSWWCKDQDKAMCHPYVDSAEAKRLGKEHL